MSTIQRRILKVVIPFIIFVITLFAAEKLMNKGNTDMTADMSGATLPVVYLNVNDEYVNPLHGYTMEMEGNYLRGCITPLMANRSISFRADLYDAVIAKVSYELRPKDMSRLIEDTEVSDFTYEGDYIYATATLKDLIEDDTEYMLIIKLTTSGGDVIRYYARVINRAELYLGEKMTFVRDFSQKVLNKDPQNELKEYMESNAEGDNSSFAHVDIHSSLNQLLWGDLDVNLCTAQDLEILEIDEKTASMRLLYQVLIDGEYYNVTEFFRLLKGKRMYLMEYDRSVNHVIDEENGCVVNDKIIHGIVDEEIKRIENEAGNIFVFVQQNALYSYNLSDNKLSRLFAFYDSENNDERTRYNAHSIKPLKVDADGNLDFIVYGYMNRGKHEGKVGVSLNYYDVALNTVDEKLFIPYTGSSLVLKKDIENLAYISTRDKFYMLFDGAVYCIDQEEKSYEIMQDNIIETGFFSSDDENIIAWQSDDDNGRTIWEYRLDKMTSDKIEAPVGERIIPLGFMDKDIIYGLARDEDVTTDEAGRTVIPMYSIRIQDDMGNILKKYEQENVYIMSVIKQDNMLLLKRANRNYETGEFAEIADDQIVNNKQETTLKNKLTTVVTELMETTYQTNLCKEPADGSVKVTNPKEVISEGSSELVIEHDDNMHRFYVYSKGELNDIYSNINDAVITADENHAVVVNKNMDYIWESENRRQTARIETINEEENTNVKSDTDADLKSEESSETGSDETLFSADYYAECLDVILKNEGVYKDTKKELKTKSITTLLEENLEAEIVDLSGVTLNDALYYVSRGYPVMALLDNNEAILIIGYDSNNTILFNPIENRIYKKGINDSGTLFEKSGNRYITYVKNE